MSAKNNKEKKDKETRLMRRQSDLPTFGTGFPFSGPTPFTMMRRFMDDMDRMFETFTGLQKTSIFDMPEMAFPELTEFEKNVWTPKIEVFKNGSEMTVHAELPGMKREDINLEIADGALILSGERKEESEEKKEGFYRSELSYGNFYRSIPLPETVTPENATASFDKGVLEIKIAIPAVEATGRKIEIKTPEMAKPKAMGAGK